MGGREEREGRRGGGGERERGGREGVRERVWERNGGANETCNPIEHGNTYRYKCTCTYHVTGRGLWAWLRG